MIMKIMLDEGAFMPTRAHKADAGLVYMQGRLLLFLQKKVLNLTQEYTLNYHLTRLGS